MTGRRHGLTIAPAGWGKTFRVYADPSAHPFCLVRF